MVSRECERERRGPLPRPRREAPGRFPRKAPSHRDRLFHGSGDGKGSVAVLHAGVQQPERPPRQSGSRVLLRRNPVANGHGPLQGGARAAFLQDRLRASPMELVGSRGRNHADVEHAGRGLEGDALVVRARGESLRASRRRQGPLEAGRAEALLPAPFAPQDIPRGRRGIDRGRSDRDRARLAARRREGCGGSREGEAPGSTIRNARCVDRQDRGELRERRRRRRVRRFRGRRRWWRRRGRSSASHAGQHGGPQHLGRRGRRGDRERSHDAPSVHGGEQRHRVRHERRALSARERFHRPCELHADGDRNERQHHDHGALDPFASGQSPQRHPRGLLRQRGDPGEQPNGFR